METIAGRYTLIEQLGNGAMGVVWRARDGVLHRDVALKRLLLPGLSTAEVEQACQRAMREARIAARLHHPNAIGVFDVVIDQGKPCLVMEYLPSRSLAAVLAERGPLPPAEVARIGSRIAAALAAAHQVGIVHRDIKPANVLLGHDGTVKITDFGISRAAGDAVVTRTGVLAGTPAYLAPELARGADPGPACDVFSLGATLYALTEGTPPFGSTDNDLALLHRIAAGRVIPPVRSGVLTDVLVRLLTDDPAHRATAAQAHRELEAVVTAPATVIAPTSPPTRALPSAPSATPVTTTPVRRRWRLIAAVVGAATLVVGAALLLPILDLTGERNAAGESTPPSTSSSTSPGTAGAPDDPTVPTSDAPRTAGFTTAEVEAFLRAHFDSLPHDTATARENWAPENRPEQWQEDQYWSNYSRVELVDGTTIIANGATFTAEVALALTPQGDAEVTVQPYQVIVVARDQRLWLIDMTPA
ncbi:serine/threonine-protein kinase [Actinosynnema sp. NPDC050801]|uniref:serine/threonine-protein kinase n=1 Tax=unclassified Actinosynnema TaxID=2637065 RepID=UPI0033FCC7FD